MKTCPFCAEEIQDAAVVCKHCRRDLPQIQQPPPPSLPPSVTPPPGTTAATVGGKRLGIATGKRRIVALSAVGVGFVLSFFASPLPMFGFVLIWLGLAGSVVNAAALLRWGVTLVLALAMLVPSSSFRSAREAREAEQAGAKAAQARAKAIQERDARTLTVQAAAKVAAEEAAHSFPERRASIQERLTAIEGATKGKQWPTAQQRLRELHIELMPLFTSAIAKSSEITTIKARMDAQQAVLSRHATEQQAAELNKQAAEAARAAATADAARQASWRPDPITMSVHCERYAKERVLDGDASFSVETLRKRGKTYIMQGQVIGHNAFNARIAKRAVCKVFMDKDGTETYATSTVD